jgi:uncharacterized protein YukE
MAGSTLPAAEITSRSGRYCSSSQATQSARVSPRMLGSLPSTGRPAAGRRTRRSNRWSWIRSSGASRHSPSSDRITSFSRSSSASSSFGARTRSAISSSARPTSGASVRAWKAVWSRAVQALSDSADILDRLGDGAGVAAARALEHHMLDQVGEPALAVGFGARADEGVQPDRRRLRARHRVDGDGHAIGEAGQLSHASSPSFRQRQRSASV